jgi:hypothetical protein
MSIAPHDINNFKQINLIGGGFFHQQSGDFLGNLHLAIDYGLDVLDDFTFELIKL